jgi:hypothetical protein
VADPQTGVAAPSGGAGAAVVFPGTTGRGNGVGQILTSGPPDRPEIVRVDAAVHEVSGDEPDFTVAVLGLPAQQAERFLWSDTEMGVQHSLGLLDDGLRLERRMKVVNHLTAFPVHGRVVQCGPP